MKAVLVIPNIQSINKNLYELYNFLESFHKRISQNLEQLSTKNKTFYILGETNINIKKNFPKTVNHLTTTETMEPFTLSQNLPE